MIVIASVILLILSLFFFFKKKCDNVETFVYPGKFPGISVLLIGGTHGNEPAGTLALQQLKEDLSTGKIKVKHGKIVILPSANKCGLALGTRFQPHHLLTAGMTGNIDLNSGYDLDNAGCDVAREIGSIASGCDWVIDLHEGWDWHARNPESMGSGVYYGSTPDAEKIANELTGHINKSIQEKDKKFVCKRWKNAEGSLRLLCDKIGVNYILMETTGQNDVQPIDLRVKQHYDFLKKFLALVNLVH